MDLSIPWELLQLKELVSTFVDRELAPLEAQVDADDDIDPATMHRLRMRAVELGFYAFNLPEELGGGGVGALGEALLGEVIGRTSIPLAEAIGRLPSSLVLCDESQAEWLLKPLVAAEKTACIALTEPDAGSDLGGLRTRAVRCAEGWRLSGSKQFISNIHTSDYVLVLAVTDPAATLRERLTVFVVERTNPGLHITHRFRKMGWHGYHIGSFSLDDCVVGPDCVLGDEARGFDTMMASVNATRLFIAARCVGAAQELLRLSVEHANSRQTFGRRLGDHQGIQFMLADMDVELEAARLLVLAAASKVDSGAPDARIAASRAKLYATEMSGRAADSALQILGGAGFMADLPVERMYRDLRGYRIGEGSSEMQRIQIARHALANPTRGG